MNLIADKCNITQLPEIGPLLHYAPADNSSIGTVIIFMCDEGKLLGPTAITCNTTGQWSADPSTVECENQGLCYLGEPETGL